MDTTLEEVVMARNNQLSLPRQDYPRAGVDACREVIRQHANTFYFGSLFLDRARRAAVWAVYAACRIGDDVVDEGVFGTAQERQAGLEAWWQCIENAYAGRPAGEVVWEALAWAVQRYAIPIEAFEELHQGFLMDLNGSAFTCLADLELYCHRVAGVVGLMITPVCGFNGGEQTLAQALRLGQAMQLTNILRDVGEDVQMGRVYLPADMLTTYGLDRGFLLRGEVTPEYQKLMQALVKLARQWYGEGEAGIGQLHGPTRLAVGVAARAYKGILDVLERNQYDNFQHRAVVGGRRKLALIPGTLWQLRGGHATSR
ncbi:MAG: phytoene/squalene synthase family protein [Herpetosiphon sp.]